MELIKRLTIFALLTMVILSSGCNGETTNNSQKQSEIVTSTDKSNSVTVENTAGEAVSPANENRDVPEAQTSPSENGNGEPKDEANKTNEDQSATSQNNDEKSVSQGEPSTPNGSPSNPHSRNESNESMLDDKFIWAIGGVAITLISLAGWQLFRRRKKEDIFEPESQKNSINRHDYDRKLKRSFRIGNFHNIGKRDEQQDSFCISDIHGTVSVERKGIMAVVADGMGGLEGGAAISQLVADTFLEEYNRKRNIESPSEFLYETANAAEVAAEKYMEQHDVDGGSTLVSVLIKGNEMHFLSVGDSHIYILSDNRITLINKEHNFAAVLKEKAARGEVAPDEPYVNPRRNSLTAYIGMGSFQIMDTNDKTIALKPGDKVFLCSDGVFNTLKDAEIKDMLSDDAIVAAERLRNAVLLKGNPKQDNFTGVIVEYVSD